MAVTKMPHIGKRNTFMTKLKRPKVTTVQEFRSFLEICYGSSRYLRYAMLYTCYPHLSGILI